MKDYKEMAESLFQRREKYNIELKKRNQRVKRITSFTACFAIVLTGVGIAHSNLFNTNISVDDQISTPASSETKLIPLLEDADISSSSSLGEFDVIEVEYVEVPEGKFFEKFENILTDSTPDILEINSGLNISFIE